MTAEKCGGKANNSRYNEARSTLPGAKPIMHCTRTQTIRRLPLFMIGLLLLLLPTACSLLPGQETATATAPANTRTAAVFPTPTATTRPTAEPTATPQPTPIRPLVRVADQEVGEDGALTIAEVALPEAGWLTVFSTAAGEAGELLGYVDLPAGVHRDVQVTIDPTQATDTLVAQLRREGGVAGELELPEPDGLMAEDALADFAVTLNLPQPALVVADQTIAGDGVVTIDTVEALAPTWVVIHADDDGAAGAVLGQVLLDAGEHEAVTLPIRWRMGTPQLHAILHEDGDELRYLDYPNGDPPLLANGVPIGVSFAVTYPPDVVVYDQPVIDGEITVDRVISNGPGWVVVHRDEDGQPGLIIGSAPLQDGLNEQIQVDLIESALTPVLYARLHEDTVPGDVFNFPEADPPVLAGGRLPTAQRIRTDAGGYVIIRDQPLTAGDAILADVVMATSDAWLAIHADEDGAPGEVLGQTWLPRGLARDVMVTIDSPPAAGPLHAVLYQDAGEPEAFEYPDGPDTPFRVQGGTVAVPFALLPTPTQP